MRGGGGGPHGSEQRLHERCLLGGPFLTALSIRYSAHIGEGRKDMFASIDQSLGSRQRRMMARGTDQMLKGMEGKGYPVIQDGSSLMNGGG